MKRIVFAVILAVASVSSISTKAQVNVNINIAQQPAWGPTGYDHVDYYYLPDVDAYYYVPSRQYVYLDNGAWVWRNNLPSRYSNYDLYKGYKVVINNPKAYLSHQSHVQQYGKYKGNQGKQVVIRDSRNSRPSVRSQSVNNGGKSVRKTNNGKGNGSNKDRGNRGGNR